MRSTWSARGTGPTSRRWSATRWWPAAPTPAPSRRGALLIFSADSEDLVHSQLNADPVWQEGLIEERRIQPLNPAIGSLAWYSSVVVLMRFASPALVPISLWPETLVVIASALALPWVWWESWSNLWFGLLVVCHNVDATRSTK